MNTELFLGIIVIILVAAAGVYFYLGRKPSSVTEPTKVEPRVLARPAAAASGEAAKEDAPAPAENKPEAEGAADTPAPAQTPESVPSPQPVADTENFFSEYRPEEGDDVQYEEPDIDQMTEIVVKIKSPEPFTANRAWLVIKPLNQDFGTPLRIQAKNQITRLWEHIKRGGTYTDMVVTLQLATRTKTVDELTAGNFAAAVNQVAASLDADADIVDVPSMVSQAKAVRALIDRFGITLSIAVKSVMPLTQQRAVEIARACGFNTEKNALVMRDADSAAPWLRLLPHPENPLMVTLELTPALCAPSKNPLGALFSVANYIAARENAVITDVSGVPLTSAAIVSITQQLRFFYEAMSKQGLDPGTRRTKRLFA